MVSNLSPGLVRCSAASASVRDIIHLPHQKIFQAKGKKQNPMDKGPIFGGKENKKPMDKTMCLFLLVNTHRVCDYVLDR